MTTTPSGDVHLSGTRSDIVAFLQRELGEVAGEGLEMGGIAAGRVPAPARPGLQHVLVAGAVGAQHPHDFGLALDHGILQQIGARELATDQPDVQVEHVGRDLDDR